LKPQEIGPFLGMKGNAVSALLFRAREGLRKAWFKASYGQTSLPAACAQAVELLELESRKPLSSTQHDELQAHLAECAHCRAVRDESEDARKRLALLILPPVVGAGALASQVFAPVPAMAVAPLAPGFLAEHLSGGVGMGGLGVTNTKATTRTTKNTALVVGIAVAAALAVGASAIGVPYLMRQIFSESTPARPAPAPTAAPQPMIPTEPDDSAQPDDAAAFPEPEVSDHIDTPVTVPAPVIPPRPTMPSPPPVTPTP